MFFCTSEQKKTMLINYFIRSVLSDTSKKKLCFLHVFNYLLQKKMKISYFENIRRPKSNNILYDIMILFIVIY